MPNQKCVTYQSTCKLGCSVFPTAAVICVPSYFLNRLVCPESEEPGTYEYTTLEGVIVAEQGIGAGCGGVSSYKYTFCYDEALTVLGLTITGNDITGIFTEECWGQWVKDLVGNESFIRTEEDDSQTFISEHGCEYPLVSADVCLASTQSVELELNDDGCIFATVNISEDEGNILESHADGLFAEAEETAVCVTDSTTINFSIDGGGCVTGSVILQPNGGENPVNILVANAEGLFVPEFDTPNFSGAINNMTGAGALPQALTVEANANAASFTINLPAAASVVGRIWFIKKVNTNANTVTLDPNGAELIDGAATFVLTVSRQSVMIQSDGTGWIILASYL